MLRLGGCVEGNPSNEICVLFCLSILVETELLHHCVCQFETTLALLILNCICSWFNHRLCQTSTLRSFKNPLMTIMPPKKSIFSIPSFELCAFVEALFPTPMLRILLDHYFLMKRCVSTTVVYSVDLLCDLFYLCQEKNHTKLLTGDNRSHGGQMIALRRPI